MATAKTTTLTFRIEPGLKEALRTAAAVALHPEFPKEPLINSEVPRHTEVPAFFNQPK